MWVGESGLQAPAPTELIGKALGLWKYAIRGKEIPRMEITALRQFIPAREQNAKAAFQYKKELRQTIGELTLAGKLDVTPGRTAGVMVMEVLCGRKDSSHLSMIHELTQLMDFTLGGYNLKEMTALALRADEWLQEKRDRKSDEEDLPRRKRRMRELLEELVGFLATTREENFKIFMKVRRERAMAPVHEELRKVFLREPTFKEILAELLALETKVSGSWRSLRDNPSQEVVEMSEIFQQVPRYEKAFNKFERRTEDRQLTPEEKKWKVETEKQLASLRCRADHLWSTFYRSVVTEINSILSDRREMEILEEGAL